MLLSGVAALVAGCAAMPEQRPNLASPLLSPAPGIASTLPRLEPIERSQRDIETLAAAELIRWIVPLETARLVESEVIPSRWGRLRHLGLWEAPMPAGPPNLCVVTGLIVTLETDENKLTPQQSIDPPLRPAEISPARRWRVVGSTLSEGPQPTQATCASAKPYYQWPETTSGAALFEAANLVEQAQVEARRRRASYSYRCVQTFYDEGASDLSRRYCPTGFIQKLTPDRIRRVDEATCATDLPPVKGGRCWKLDYELREGDGYFYYTVLVGGTSRPQALFIEQYIPPPH